MKYIKLFNTDSEYQEFASSAAQPIPNVSYVTETDEVHYNESDPILFAYEYQSDKFVMGVVIGSDIYVDTYETGFIVADGSGKFSTALAYTNDDLINIQNAIKDHYHLAASTIKTKAPLIEYAVGDTVPNWNAYEKIKIPERFLWKYREMGGEGSVFGKVENDILICYAKSQGHVLIADENGLIISDTNVGEEFFVYLIKPRLNNLGITYTTISYDTSSYSENDNVENWNDYIDIT